jgi:predicted ester cyclase
VTAPPAPFVHLASTGELMSIQDNKNIATAVFPAAWNHGDFGPAEKYVDPDVVDHFDNSRGIDAFKGVINGFRAAFPDIRLSILMEIAEDDLVVHHWSMTGTHQGELQGIPPTGKTLTWTGTTIVRISEGKIVERWANVDILGILQQLGVVPPPPTAP